MTTDLGNTHAARMTKYQHELREWKARADEARRKIRLRLEDPFWEPSNWRALGIGPPPTPPASHYL